MFRVSSIAKTLQKISFLKATFKIIHSIQLSLHPNHFKIISATIISVKYGMEKHWPIAMEADQQMLMTR
jgi:hypothetical protein